MKQLTIGVVFGSRSTEHDVSIITALASVIKPLELSGKFKVVPIYISKQGKWYVSEKLKNISLFTSGDIEAWCQRTRPAQLVFDEGLKLVCSGFRSKTIQIDIGFPALHGTHGEDGEVMAIFELAGIPYVGCGVAASAVTMNKVLAKQVVAAHGLPIVPFCHFTRHEFAKDSKKYLNEINKTLKYPLFVKPTHLGSSIGITRVDDRKHLLSAIEVALHYDNQVLVEEGVLNLIEVTLPVMGNDEPIPALLEQPAGVNSQDFFDFETKYMHGGKKGKKAGKHGAQGYSTIPANLPKDLYQNAEATGIGAYKALGCMGIARIDMLINSKTKAVYFNEANPLPGSLYAHNWNHAGYSSVALVSKLVELALERHAAMESTETVFKTNYLKQF